MRIKWDTGIKRFIHMLVILLNKPKNWAKLIKGRVSGMLTAPGIDGEGTAWEPGWNVYKLRSGLPGVSRALERATTGHNHPLKNKEETQPRTVERSRGQRPALAGGQEPTARAPGLSTVRMAPSHQLQAWAAHRQRCGPWVTHMSTPWVSLGSSPTGVARWWDHGTWQNPLFQKHLLSKWIKKEFNRLYLTGCPIFGKAQGSHIQL